MLDISFGMRRIRYGWKGRMEENEVVEMRCGMKVQGNRNGMRMICKRCKEGEMSRHR